MLGASHALHAWDVLLSVASVVLGSIVTSCTGAAEAPMERFRVRSFPTPELGLARIHLSVLLFV